MKDVVLLRSYSTSDMTKEFGVETLVFINIRSRKL